MNLRSWEEFALILSDMGIKTIPDSVQKVFINSYVKRLEQLANVLDDEQASMTQQYSKKFPLNVNMIDDAHAISNSRLVDVEWRLLYQLSSKNLNKVF